MVFNSYIFILAFLPAFIFLYYLLNKINAFAGKALIIIGGIVFYAYAGWEVTAILGASIVINYLSALAVSKSRFKKAFLVSAIIINTALLLYFKYLNFAIDIVNGIANSSFQSRDLILPLGISFFTFQQIMYVVSVSKGETDTNLFDYLAYILYFPKLIMGPLAEPKDFFNQLHATDNKKLNAENLASGIKLFSFGLFKKMLLADTFAKAVTWGFANGVTTEASSAVATAGDLILVMLFYTFQIYFDFSGYSDMAIGISKMLNIDLPINFDSPYKATSIRDFWKRWHISLTSFLTKYIYFPLGGSKKGSVRTYANIMIVFLVSGIWHGANWTFILWGCLHGLLQIIERLFKNKFEKLSEVVRWGYTFVSVNILWLLFRSDSIHGWLEMLKTIIKFDSLNISKGLIKAFEIPESNFILEKLHLIDISSSVHGFNMLVFLFFAFFICLVPENNYRNMNKLNVFNMVLCAVAFIWGFLCLSSESVFVYFNF